MSGFGNWRCPSCNAAGIWTKLDDERLLCDNCGHIATRDQLRAADHRAPPNVRARVLRETGGAS